MDRRGDAHRYHGQPKEYGGVPPATGRATARGANKYRTPKPAVGAPERKGGWRHVDGWWGRSRFPDREALAEYREFCTDRGATFQLERLTRESDADDPPFELTEEQYEALVAAREAGYFDVPREVSTEEIGEKLGISGPSASERLRRGIDRLLENAL